MTENEILKAELERVRKQAAAMREAIERCIADWKDRHIGLLRKALEPAQDVPTPDELRAKAETYSSAAADLEHALKCDDGREYVSKHQVWPLVEALYGIRANLNPWNQLVVATESSLECLDNGIKHARTIDLWLPPLKP